MHHGAQLGDALCHNAVDYEAIFLGRDPSNSVFIEHSMLGDVALVLSSANEWAGKMVSPAVSYTFHVMEVAHL